jgi:hypothetical protein
MRAVLACRLLQQDLRSQARPLLQPLKSALLQPCHLVMQVGTVRLLHTLQTVVLSNILLQASSMTSSLELRAVYTDPGHVEAKTSWEKKRVHWGNHQPPCLQLWLLLAPSQRHCGAVRTQRQMLGSMRG